MSSPYGPKEVLVILRDFYSQFGMPDEGPSPELENIALIDSLGLPSTEELERISTVTANDEAKRSQVDCRYKVEAIANQLIGPLLLQELQEFSDNLKTEEFDYMISGTMWFSMAASLDKRDIHGLPVLPVEFNQVEIPLSMRIMMTVQGSLIFRLYIALVYNREGPLYSIIRRAGEAGKPCAKLVFDLLDCEYVRYLRNSLAHGTFSTTIAGVVFRDRNSFIAGSPGFLAHLALWINLVQLQALAAGKKG